MTYKLYANEKKNKQLIRFIINFKNNFQSR